MVVVTGGGPRGGLDDDAGGGASKRGQGEGSEWIVGGHHRGSVAVRAVGDQRLQPVERGAAAGGPVLAAAERARGGGRVDVPGGRGGGGAPGGPRGGAPARPGAVRALAARRASSATVARARVGARARASALGRREPLQPAVREISSHQSPTPSSSCVCVCQWRLRCSSHTEDGVAQNALRQKSETQGEYWKTGLQGGREGSILSAVPGWA